MHLIITVDYELFGDGTGCLEACVLRPMERMMRIAERFGAPLTFFAEALEFIALAEQDHDRRARNQLREALARGHDVQLHLHPQWHHAERDAQGAWRLNMDRWRIGDLPQDEVESLLQQGQEWLEGEVAARVSGYRCLAFRAGGWCIQPSAAVVKALLALAFRIDSTVAPGFRNLNRGEWCDFRNVPGRPYWKTEGDVCRMASAGLWEVPIVTGRIGKWRHLQAVRAAHLAGERGMAPGCRGSYRGPGSRLQTLLGKWGKLLRLGTVMLDLSTMSAEVLIEISEQWLDRFGQAEQPLPMVAIAHTKNFTERSAAHLQAYLDWATRRGIRFSTYGAWLEAIGE